MQAFVGRESEQSLQELFIERLGEKMPRSAFARPLPEDVAESRGYANASSPETRRGMTNVHDDAMAAGSLATNAEDFARFLALVCQGDGLHPDTHAEMTSPLAEAPEEGAPFPMAYGLGWIVADMGGESFIGHGGNNGEYRSFAGYMAGSGDGIVILTNSETGQDLIEALTSPGDIPQ